MSEQWNHAGRVFNPESPGDGNSMAVAVVALVALVAVLAAAFAWSRGVRWHGIPRGER